MNLEKLTRLDKRWIFLGLILVIIVPQLAPVGTPEFTVAPESQLLFDAVDALPEGAPVLISFDFDPASKPELYPAAIAILKHAFRKKLRIICMGLVPSGTGMAAQVIQDVAVEHYGSADEAKAHYGKDYVFLGWSPGMQAVIVLLGEGIQTTYAIEFHNETPTSQLAVLDGVSKLKDLSLVISLSTGSPGLEEWLQYGQGKYGIKLGAAVTAVTAPSMLTFIRSGQLVGLLGGMKGAAEYEKLAEVPGYAHDGLNALSASHMFVIVLIGFSNVVYFLSAWSKKH